MRVLLIKTSSMGDLIHTLPALSDAAKHIPNISFDWVVEDYFAEIPHWHPTVKKVIPVALRRWRKQLFSVTTRAEWAVLRKTLQASSYDLILDAQGLVKSAFLTYFASGVRVGLDWTSARESLASLAYQQKYTVNFYQHAVVRMRSLFAQALDYPIPTTTADFGIVRPAIQSTTEKYIVFLHGTTWTTKLWPEEYWRMLGVHAANAGYKIKVSGGNTEEMERANRIAEGNKHVQVVPRLTLQAMAALLSGAQAVVAVDTGFGHLAAAMNLPTVSIYGATNPEFTGAIGKNSYQLFTENFQCAPCLSRKCHYQHATLVTPACYATLPPDKVWAKVKMALG